MAPQERHIPVQYNIGMEASRPSMNLTLLIPRPPQGSPSPFQTDSNHGDIAVWRVPLTVLLNLTKPVPWLDRRSLQQHLVEGAGAIGLREQGQLQDIMTAVEESAGRLSVCCPPGCVTIKSTLLMSESVVVFAATVEEQQQQRVTTPVRAPPGMESQKQQRKLSPPDPESLLEPLMSLGFSRKQCLGAIAAIRDASPSPPPPAPAAAPPARAEPVPAAAQNGDRQPGQDIVDYLYDASSSAPPPIKEQRPEASNQNTASANSADEEPSAKKTESSPRKAWGAAATAAASPHEDIWRYPFLEGQNAGIAAYNPSAGAPTTSPPSTTTTPSSPWGNASKLQAVKSMVPHHKTGLSTASPSSAKNVRVLDVPQEMNGFVFHCNAQTREECLERQLFGCPAGGQYGPHSKAKKGDILLLADFSSWTVSGIFVAESDAAMNLERGAWNGRFPWQIRIHPPPKKLQTVHVDKVNEILGLQSGSKLNMLVHDQLLRLLRSKEFAPFVPAHLYKVKQAVATIASPKPHPSTVTTQGNMSRHSSSSSSSQTEAFPGTREEHPATAVRRLKLISEWFDSMANKIQQLNQQFQAQAISGNWPIMPYTHIRKGVGDIFNQWLFQAHSFGNQEGRDARKMKLMAAGGLSPTQRDGISIPVSFDETESWTRQGRSGSSTAGEDPVLLSHVPFALENVKGLFLSDRGSTALRIPTDGLADRLAGDFIQELEHIAGQVRSTQQSHVRMGAGDYSKSLEDASLGMRLTEETTNYYDEQTGDTEQSAMIKIEWVTKSSLLHGRPPPSQKLYKSHFETLCRNYREACSVTDPELKHILTRIFVLLCRYDIIGTLKSGYQAAVPPNAFLAMERCFGVTHECFASPLNRTCPSYNSIFPDTDRHFGSLGSFFDFSPREGSFEANPPFDGGTMKMMFEHVLRLLRRSDDDRNALSFLLVIPKTSDSVALVKESPYLRRSAVIEAEGEGADAHFYLMGMQHKETGGKNLGLGNKLGDMWKASVPTLLLWLQNDFGYDLWTPTDEKVQAVAKGFRGQAELPVGGHDGQ